MTTIPTPSGRGSWSSTTSLSKATKPACSKSRIVGERLGDVAFLGVSQARCLSEVETVAREVIADLTEIDPNEVEVEVTVDPRPITHPSSVAASALPPPAS